MGVKEGTIRMPGPGVFQLGFQVYQIIEFIPIPDGHFKHFCRINMQVFLTDMDIINQEKGDVPVINPIAQIGKLR